MSGISAIAAESMRVAEDTRRVCKLYDGDGLRWSVWQLNEDRPGWAVSGDDLARLTRGPR